MDDPWGSPWARTDPDKDPRPSSPAKSDLAPPPRAFLSASNSPRISAALEQSPWGGDDDGFGDWATATTSAPDTPSGHGVWAGGWGGSSPHLSASPRDDVLGKATPIAWPGNVATPKPASGSGFPQPSPDPWASGFSSRRPSIDGTSTPRLVVDVASPVEERPETFRKDVLGIEEGSIWDKSDSGDTTKQATIENQDAISRNPEDVPEVMLHDEEHGSEEPPAEELIARTPRTENQVVEDQPVNEETAKEEATTVGTVEKETDWEGTAAEATTPALASENDVRMSVESAALGREYQSTTPSHENTDHEDERQDSPITPIDDETRIHRPVSRKTSGKVQELVVKFDGLARAASQERAPVSRASSSSPPSVRQRVLSDDAVDFGDFEDADDADDVEPPLAVDTTSELLAEERHADAHIAPAPLSFERNIGSTTAAGSPVSKFGPLHFSADLDMIGKLFPALGGSPGRDIDIDREVPDQVISDSFTEISERKTWYRVSRFGSSRRHNAGDDESYRRVVWPTSTVHQDTIKIVRRWMEEDSIAGRVALGGGISKTQKNMFGWDSSAEPVDLDTVFKKRSHSRTSSLQPLQPISFSLEGPDIPANKAVQAPTHRPSGSAGPTVASFGWSSSSPPSMKQTTSSFHQTPRPNIIAALPKSAVSPPQPPSILAAPDHAASKQANGSVQPIPQPSDAQAGADEIHADDDDDDEWGEMVSSPTTARFVANGSAPRPLAVSAATAPEKAVVDIQQSGGPNTGNPWGAADFSVFESAPAKSAPHVQATTPTPEVLDLSGKGLASAPNTETLCAAVPSTLGPASTSRPSVLSSLGSSETPKHAPHHQHDEVADRIIANLPDLSYMLR